MSNVTALGSRPIQSTLPRAATQDEGVAAGAQAASASGKVPARLPVVDPVSLSAGSVTLSQQALNARVAQLGDKTVDVAQKFISNFAQSLFGDAAKGASFSFDAISLSADTSLAASVDHTQSAAGSADSATLQFNESSAFIGSGQIVTSDGQSFDFQIEVRYQASATATASSTQGTQNTQNAKEQETLPAPDALALTGKQLPPIKYPGSLADLFKVLGRQLDVSTNAGGNNGDLSLRLLRLVNSAALLAPRAPVDSPAPTATERNRALASYAPPETSSTVTSA